MRITLTALVLSAAAGCASPAQAPAAAGPKPSLTLDLFPFDAASAQFRDSRDAASRTLRVEPAPDGRSARLTIAVPGGSPATMLVTRREASLDFSAGSDAPTELIRAGALPGDAWPSNNERVTFEGWEHVTSAPPGASSWEAARISARRGPSGLEIVQTWWFAPGAGLVRLRSDKGHVMVDELVRASP